MEAYRKSFQKGKIEQLIFLSFENKFVVIWNVSIYVGIIWNQILISESELEKKTLRLRV